NLCAGSYRGEGRRPFSLRLRSEVSLVNFPDRDQAAPPRGKWPMSAMTRYCWMALPSSAVADGDSGAVGVTALCSWGSTRGTKKYSTKTNNNARARTNADRARQVLVPARPARFYRSRSPSHGATLARGTAASARAESPGRTPVAEFRGIRSDADGGSRLALRGWWAVLRGPG